MRIASAWMAVFQIPDEGVLKIPDEGVLKIPDEGGP
jgi:hypothetical protein